MKVVLLALLWCTAVFLSLLTLYKVIPPEAQYSFAEHFEIYGDELIMDFVLYLFFRYSHIHCVSSHTSPICFYTKKIILGSTAAPLFGICKETLYSDSHLQTQNI